MKPRTARTFLAVFGFIGWLWRLFKSSFEVDDDGFMVLGLGTGISIIVGVMVGAIMNSPPNNTPNAVCVVAGTMIAVIPFAIYIIYAFVSFGSACASAAHDAVIKKLTADAAKPEPLPAELLLKSDPNRGNLTVITKER